MSKHDFVLPILRKIHRNIRQDMMEWDEENPEGTVPKQECDWSMLRDRKDGYLLFDTTCYNKTFTSSFEFIHPTFSTFICPGVLALEDAHESDTKPIAQPAHNATDAELGFPEAQGDMAPSALVPKATQCITKHTGRINQVLTTFNGCPSLTPLQARTGS